MKRIFIALFLGSLCLSVFSQKFHGGLMLGLNASQISGDKLEGYHRAGPYAGAYSSYDFNEKWTLQLEIAYIQKGSRRIYKDAPVGNYKLNMHYFEMPLLVKWNVYKRLSILAGPAIGVLIGAVEKDSYGKMNNPDRPSFKLYEFSGMAGMEVRINQHFKADFRALNSILPVRKPMLGTGYRLDRLQYHNSLLLSLIYEIK